jgi:hypothetical protein
MQRGPNIIIHPTRRNGISSTKSFFGMVMMSDPQGSLDLSRSQGEAMHVHHQRYQPLPVGQGLAQGVAAP